MISNNFLQSAEVTVDAVVARTRMPAASLAALEPGDFVDLEAQAGSELVVRLVADGSTVAVASIEEVNGQLVATIINNGPGTTGGRIDQWMCRKAKTTV
jgi:flagellar motor switch/type III secretory pathway protein FliN